MAGELTSTLGAFYKTFYRDYLGNDVMKASPFSMRIMEKGKKIELGGASRNATWAIKNAHGIGASALSEGGNYPAALNMSGINPVIALTDFAFTGMISGHAESMGSSKDKTFLEKKLIRTMLDDLRATVKRRIAQLLMWDGTDILGTTSTSTATTNGYITFAAGAAPMSFFQPGDELTIRTATSGGTECITNAATGGGRIVAVDPDLGRVYLADSTGINTGGTQYAAWANFYGSTMPQGLRILVDSTGTVNGLARATAANAALRCHEITVSGALGPSDADRIRDTVWETASIREDGYRSDWVGNAKTRRQLAYATIGQVRFASIGDQQVGTPTMKIGDVDGVKDFITDQYLIDGELYVVDATQIGMAYPEGQSGGYLKENGPGNYLFQANASSGTGHSDSQRAYHIWRGQSFIDNCRSHGKLTGWTAAVA